MNIFQIITTFGNLLGQIEAIVASGSSVSVMQIEGILETILKDMGILLPRDAPLFNAFITTIATIPNIITEAGKLSAAKVIAPASARH